MTALVLLLGIIFQMQVAALASHEATHLAQRVSTHASAEPALDLGDCGLCVAHQGSNTLPAWLAPSLIPEEIPQTLENPPVHRPEAKTLGSALARGPPGIA